MFDLPACLTQLANRRPVFHSEADFQHALAWIIQENFPNAQIRLELPFSQSDRQSYLDIFVRIDNHVFGIELKYKTKSLVTVDRDEIFQLKNQSAQDLGRYDFLKDIQRLEHFVTIHQNCVGYAVFLTNDSSYWNPSRKIQTIDQAFRLHEGREISGDLQWYGASVGTMNMRESQLRIRNKYLFHWADYANIDAKLGGSFRFLLLKIE